MRPWTDRQLAIVLVLVLVLAIAGIWGALRALAPAPAPTGIVTAHLTIETRDWTLTYEATTTNTTVLTFLLEAADRRGFEVEYTLWPELGALVTAIQGVRDGQDGLWWQYWVNGVYADMGADRYVLRDGDAVLWWHTTYPPEG